VAINCAAIPENLLESELFGHEKGAFTGAVSRKAGRIEAANGGTLFLDEIGDMPMALQAKILRFLQERTFERVGGNVSIEADVRVLCATHNDLETMIGDGRFREDLYYRLSEIVIRLPPLKDRTDDSVLLATYFIKENAERRIRLSNEAQNAIRAYDWPGNIRELENRIRRALILCDEDLIEASDLELAPPSDDDLPLNLRTVRATAEREAILRALSRSASNVSQAARLLGVSRPTLYNLFEKYEINPDNQS
jgi:two-component system NtrC family response regulator